MKIRESQQGICQKKTKPYSYLPFSDTERPNLLVHSEIPEREDDSMPSLDIIFYDASIFHVLYLLFTFFPTSFLKSIITIGEIRNPRVNALLFYSHLIVEESFPYIGSGEIVHG